MGCPQQAKRQGVMHGPVGDPGEKIAQMSTGGVLDCEIAEQACIEA